LYLFINVNWSIICLQVVSLDMMTASGEVIHISKEENSDLLPATTLSLGSLGIILTVTLQCELAFNLHQKQYPARLKDVSCKICFSVV
jgi:L-gulonolactone oxidase